MNPAVKDQQPIVSTSSKFSKNKKPFIIAGLLIFLIADGVLVYFLLQKSKNPEPDSISSPLPTSTQPADASSSHYVGTQTITLHDVSDGSSSAQLTRVFSQGKVEHTIEATLPDTSENTFYQAWAINPEKPKAYLGKLAKNAEGKYYLFATYDFNPIQTITFEDLYNSVVISLETVDDDVIENKILEGAFTQ